MSARMKGALWPAIVVGMTLAAWPASAVSREAGPAPRTALSTAARVNINTADAESLSDGLLGVGPAKAAAIVAWRRQNGPFRNMAQLMDVKGIGPALLERNRDRIALR